MDVQGEGEVSSDSNIMVDSDDHSEKHDAINQNQQESSLPTVLSQASLRSGNLGSLNPRIKQQELMEIKKTIEFDPSCLMPPPEALIRKSAIVPETA